MVDSWSDFFLNMGTTFATTQFVGNSPLVKENSMIIEFNEYMNRKNLEEGAVQLLSRKIPWVGWKTCKHVMEACISGLSLSF